nr:hypothetical protein [uncultured Sphingomonas sp.]
MSARGFGSILWAGAVAGAALSFYLVSLRVASERAKLEDVESQIAMTQRDIRLLQTELGTRGRLAQLERWNVKFIQLSAPTADQFVDGGFQLATLARPDERPAVEAPVVLASAPVDHSPSQPRLTGDADTAVAAPTGADAPKVRTKAPSEMIHLASYSVPPKAAPVPVVVAPKVAGKDRKSAASPPVKPAATKPTKTATTDPLSPLPKAASAGKAAVKSAPPGGSAKPVSKKPKGSADD